LRYWGEKGSSDRIGEILEVMQREGIQHDVLSLAEASQGYARAGKIEKAEELLQQMIDQLERSDDRHRKAVGESILQILLAYRNSADLNHSFRDAKDTAIQRAESLTQKIIGDSTILDENRRSE